MRVSRHKESCMALTLLDLSTNKDSLAALSEGQVVQISRFAVERH